MIAKHTVPQQSTGKPDDKREGSIMITSCLGGKGSLYSGAYYAASPAIVGAIYDSGRLEEDCAAELWEHMMQPPSESVATQLVYGGADGSNIVGMVKGGADPFHMVLMMPGSMKHSLIKRGMPTRVLTTFIDQKFKINSKEAVYHSLGLSGRTIRRKTEAELLSSQHSDTAFALMEVMELAAEVLGDMDAAEEWLTSSATGLDNQRPIDLLSTYPGVESVKTLLSRIRFGVYA